MAYAPIQINHSPQTTYTGNEQLNFPGAQTVSGRRGVLPNFTDANSMFVSQTTGSSANPGTRALPKASFAQCFGTYPANFYYVVCLDSAIYDPGFFGSYINHSNFPNFVGIYALDGQAPVFTIQRGATPGTYGAGNGARIISGTPNYYIAKNGNDSTGQRGNALYPFLTIQGALNDGSRQSGDIFQVQDSGIYSENISVGTVALTLRAAQGQTPELDYPGTGAAQITFATNSLILGIDGFIINAHSYQTALLLCTNGSNTAASVNFVNCTIINQYGISRTSSGNFTNCAFSNIVSFLYQLTNPSTSFPPNGFLNCYFSQGNNVSYMPIGCFGASLTACTFSSCIMTGAFLNSTIPTIVGPGGFLGPVQISNCFFNDSSLNADYIPVSRYWNNGGQGFQNFLGLMNTVFFNGNVYINNNVSLTGSPVCSVNFSANNCVIYARNLPYGLFVQAYENNGVGSAPIAQIEASISNIVATGASTNFYIGSSGNQASIVLSNCTSLGASGSGLLLTGYGAEVPPGNVTVYGFLDSGSVEPINAPNFTPISSEINANVISSVQGYENCTLSANDPANFSGPLNANGGVTSIGFDVSMMDIFIPCALNGFIFRAWSPTLAQGQVLPVGNMEGAIQSSVGVPLIIQNCTFETSGTYAIKTAPATIVQNCLFSGISGHALYSNNTGLLASNNVGVGCGGAFFCNYGQVAVLHHNTAYSCEYGEFDSPQVASVISDSEVFSGSGAYDYSGAFTLTYSCVGTLDPATTAALDIYSTQADPLFQDANGGNLMLQSLAFGYFFNSPAILDASDGQDMGAYTVVYGVATTSWTLINFGLSSPDQWYNPDVMQRRRIPLKLAEGTQENGAIYSVAATYKTEYELSWKEDTNPMPMDQMEALKAMFDSFSNSVQINFGDDRDWIPGYLSREHGFEWNDLIGSYASQGPLPVKQIVIQEA